MVGATHNHYTFLWIATRHFQYASTFLFVCIALPLWLRATIYILGEVLVLLRSLRALFGLMVYAKRITILKSAIKISVKNLVS